VAQPGGGEIKAELAYGIFGRFDLPTRINLMLDFPEVEPEMVKGLTRLPRERKGSRAGSK